MRLSSSHHTCHRLFPDPRKCPAQAVNPSQRHFTSAQVTPITCTAAPPQPHTPLTFRQLCIPSAAELLSPPFLFLPGRLFLFNPLIPFLYADVTYQSIREGAGGLNQLCQPAWPQLCVRALQGQSSSSASPPHTPVPWSHPWFEFFQRCFGNKNQRGAGEP